MGYAETRAVLFADLVGSTAAYERLGDQVAKAAVDRRMMALRRAVHEQRGEVVKTLGDAVLACFHSADAAAHSALRMMADANHDMSGVEGEGFNIRAGFHWGEVILDAADIFGDAVNVAARITDAARAGQLLTTAETVARMGPILRQQVRAFDRTRLKGRKELVDIHELLWEREADVTRMGEQMTGANMAQNQQRQNLLQLTLGREQWRFASARMPLSVGRDAACDLAVRHALASRRHAQFEYQRGKFIIADHSTNGSYITLAGGREVFLRRESMPLSATGIVSLGCPLREQTEEILRFQVE